MPGQLHTVVMLGREVAPEPATMTISEQREPDEHVSPVEPGEAEEDRGEGPVAGVEADVQVLHHLCEEEGEAHEERQHHAGEEGSSGCRA